jgi:hypothetical protein
MEEAGQITGGRMLGNVRKLCVGLTHAGRPLAAPLVAPGTKL